LNKKYTHITLNAYLPSLLTGLKSNGINTESFFNNRYLKKLDLYDPNKYIPNILLDDLLISITDKIGVDCLASEFNEHFKSTKMGSVSNHLYKSPNFLCFLEGVIKYQNVIRTNYFVNLKTTGTISRFSVKVDEAKGRGKLITEEIDIVRILDAFMLVGGENFVPIEIGITSTTSYHLESIFPKGNYTLKLNQDESWILFKTSMLSKKVPDILGNANSINNTYLATEFKIERLLESFKPGYIPRLEEISEMLNISSRTLERNLQKEGTHFLNIKKRLLRRKSYDLLTNTNLSIKEISQYLDYSNSQNFIRSFKTWNNISPLQYRSNLLQLS